MAVTINGSGQVVVQVASTTSTTQFTSTSTSYVDITGLSVSITPTNSANKILVIYNFQGSATSGEYSNAYQLVRGSTAICLGVPTGSRSAATSYNRSMTGNGDQSWAMAMNFLDSPATTSATTYKIQGTTQSGGTFAVNRSVNNTDSNSVFNTPATITVMEIAYA
jgi:hypothetical protein